jgi:hypothetical protein
MCGEVGGGGGLLRVGFGAFGPLGVFGGGLFGAGGGFFLQCCFGFLGWGQLVVEWRGRGGFAFAFPAAFLVFSVVVRVLPMTGGVTSRVEIGVEFDISAV